jgi:hypothetical protein
MVRQCYYLSLLFVLFSNLLYGQNFTNYSTASTSTTLCNNEVKTIVIDAQGNKWFGTAGLSKLTEITTTVNLSYFDKDLILYPNPAKTYVNFGTPNNNGVIYMFDISGKCILTLRISSSLNSLNIARLTKGLYIVKYFSENKYTTKKLVIE